MNETEFNQQVDDTLTAIEDAIEATGEAIDFDTAGGILTLEFADGSRIIVNRQSALQQLWVAAKSGGFHFTRAGDRWLDEKEGVDLTRRLSQLVSEQYARKLQLDF